MSEFTNTINEQTKQAADSLTKDIVEEPHDIIHFIDTGAKTESVMTFSENSAVNNDAEIRSIAKLLARPVRVSAFTYGTSSIIGSELLTVRLADALNAMPLSRKLDCFYGFRANMCMEFRVNPQPFHTGALQIAYFPPAGERVNNTSTFLDSNWPETNQASVDASMIPFFSGMSDCIVFNVAKQTTMKIVRPFKWVFDYCPLDNLNLGTVVVQSLAPLGAITTDNVEGSFYFWLEDLEIMGSAAQGVPFSQWTSYNAAEFVERQAPSSKQEASGKISVSSVAKTVSNVSGALSKIPIVSDIAGPVSMAADLVGNVAGFFGFSKPTDPRPAKNIIPMKAHGKMNTDGVFSGTRMTYNSTAEVETSPLGFTDDDEMSVAHVAQKWCRWNYFKWNTSQDVGTQLVGWENSPGRYENRGIQSFPNPTTPLRITTYLSYLAHMFALWRGSIKIRMHFLANQFYSGRLRITYDIPYAIPASAAYNRSSEMYTVILDVKDANESVIELPYISVADWMFTANDKRHRSVANLPGLVRVYVENELRTNTSCPTEILVWIDVAGGDDIQFALPFHHGSDYPNPAYFAPDVQTNPVPSEVVREAPETEIQLAGSEFSDKPTFRSITDPVLSLRQLTRRYEYIGNTATHFNNWHSPWVFPMSDVTFTNWVKRMYAYSSGGLRLWSPQPMSNAHDNTIRIGLLDQGTQYTTDNSFSAGQITYSGQISFAPGDNVEIEVPYYNMFPRIGHQDQNYADASASVLLAGFHTPLTVIAGNSDVNFAWWRATADDWNCGYLLGPRWITGNPVVTLLPEAKVGPRPAIDY